jgi:hypothetical protein
MATIETTGDAGELPWDDEVWDQLLVSIDKHQVIPIVGPELSTVEVEGRRITIDQYVAEQLVAQFGAKLGLTRNELPAAPSLADVVSIQLRNRQRVSELYPKINTILSAASFAPPQALQQLAKIEHFKLFVTTAFDSLLEAALETVRFRGAAGDDDIQSVGYTLREGGDINPNKQGAATVYHLLGKVSPQVDEYVVSEEDLLEYICALQSESHHPTNLFDELRDSYLLILGGNFSGWLGRLFLRLTKQRRLSDTRVPRGLFEILADERVRTDATLVTFLSNFSPPTRVYPGTATEFVDELWRRWETRFGSTRSSGTGSSRPSGTVFISYAREDLQAARRLKAALEEERLNVWFDEERLRGGVQYDDEIRKNVNRCDLFIPLLSRNTERQVRDAYFRREWTFAVLRETKNSPNIPFILPLVVDGISRKELGHTPTELLVKNITAAPGGVPPQGFVDDIKTYLNQINAYA